MKSKIFRFLIGKKKKLLDTKKLEPATKYAYLSDKGLRRSVNQDSYGVFPKDYFPPLCPKGQLFLVADGIGGHIAGRKASEMAVNIVQESYFADADENVPISLLRAYKSANSQIFKKAGDYVLDQKMGTTCTALVLSEDRGYIAHVGDSRIYRICEKKIEQLTQDHTEVADLVRHDILTEEEANTYPERSVLSRALGIESDVEIDIKEDIQLQSNEYFVLCTDGLAKVSPEEIREIVLSNTPEESCKLLVELANQRGGIDNVTVQVVMINQPVE